MYQVLSGYGTLPWCMDNRFGFIFLGWCGRFQGSGQCLQSSQGRPWWGHLLSWVEVIMDVCALSLSASMMGNVPSRGVLGHADPSFIMWHFSLLQCGSCVCGQAGHHGSAVQNQALWMKAGQVWKDQGCLRHIVMCVVDLGGGNLWVSIQWQCHWCHTGEW